MISFYFEFGRLFESYIIPPMMYLLSTHSQFHERGENPGQFSPFLLAFLYARMFIIRMLLII